jgi:hypothetical protein
MVVSSSFSEFEAQWGEYWDEWYAEVTVCLTHKRFIPCRKDDGFCQLSVSQEDIEHVRKYQQGEDSLRITTDT